MAAKTANLALTPYTKVDTSVVSRRFMFTLLALLTISCSRIMTSFLLTGRAVLNVIEAANAGWMLNISTMPVDAHLAVFIILLACFMVALL